MSDYKYSQISNPGACSIEDLEKEVVRLKDKVDQYESQQLALKLFLNSTYGACASPYFYAHNVHVAEAITLQGQHLNHYTENTINSYFKGVFQNDEELHKAMGVDHETAKKFTISSGRLTTYPDLTPEEFPYLEGTESMTVAGDTDSVHKNTVVNISGTNQPIHKWFDYFNKKASYWEKKTGFNGSDVIDLTGLIGITTDGVDAQTGKVVNRRIRYISRHKVDKDKWMIESESGKSVMVTSDHSVMVYRNGKIISVKSDEINPLIDKLVVKKTA